MNRALLAVAAGLGALTPVVLDSALKGVVLLAVAALCALALRRASAATRHLAWLVAVVALLVLPVLSAALPQWRVLPDWTKSLRPAATTRAAKIKDGSHVVQKRYEPEPMPGTALPATAAPSPALSLPPYMPPDVSPVASYQPTSTLRDWLPLIWAVGCAMLVLRLIAAHFLLRRAARGCVVLSNANADAITTAFAAACSQLGIRRRVTLLLDKKRTIPVVWGVFRPRLLLPAEAREWNEEQLISVLLHELAHIRRRDALVQWITQIACALHWFNPLVWLAAWRLHAERERACDDLVIASGVRPSAYAEHLLQVATKLSPARWTAACGLAMARKSSLEGRLIAVLSEKLNRRGVTSTLVAIAFIFGVGVAIPVAMLRAADEKKPDAPKTAVAAAVQPKHEYAQSLFRKWQARARTDGKIPGALIGLVVRKLEDFIKQSPDSDEAKKLAALRGRFDTSHDWTPAETVMLLDEVTAIASEPVSWADMSMDFDDWNSVKFGQPLPIDLTRAAWGQPDANGLRAAWLLEPRGEQYALGSILKARVLFHNAGKAPVVFRTEGWHQSDAHTARDAKGAGIKIGGTMFTGMTPMAVYRLMPGEYCEVGGHGIAIGAGKYGEEFSTARIGAIIEAKEGDEVSLSQTVDAAQGIKFSRPGDPEDAAELWRKQVAERVAQEAPIPAAASDRTQLIRRVMLDLSGVPPTPEEIAAFTVDAAPGALDRLVEKITAKPRVEPWTGKLPTGTTKFRVIAADPNAAKAPRTANAPGRYVLGDQAHLLVSQLTEGGKRTNKAVIAFLSPDPKVASPHKPYEITLPDGIGTYGIVWDRGAGELWVMQKDLVRKYEFTNPAQVQEMKIEPGNILNIPAHMQDAMTKAFHVAGAPVQQQNSQEPKSQPPEPGAVQPVTDGKSSALVLRPAGQEPIVILTGRALTASPDSTSRGGAVTMDVATSDKTITIRYTWPEDAPGFLDLKTGGYPVSRFDLSRGRVFFVHFEKLEFSADVFQVPAGVTVPAITSPGTLTPAAAAVTNWYTASDDRALWECIRIVVPGSDYKTGQPLDAAAEKIVWGEANEAGLRLGLGGMEPGASFPVGQQLPMKQYVRNDSTKTLTFSPTQIFNEGVGGELVRTSDGKKFLHRKGYPWQSFFHRVKLAPGHYIALGSGPMSTTMAEKDGSSSGGMDMMAHGFTVLPGEYTLQLTHGIGQFLGRPVNFHFGDPRGAPGLGEWTGVLKSAAVPLRLVDEQVKTARAGGSEAFGDRYMIAFDKGVIRLRHYIGYPNMRLVGGPWEDRSRDWKVPAAGGEYVAAWAVGGKGVWVKDASGITHLIVKDVLTENGKWTLPQASGVLGGMPAGVRAALQLPPQTAPQTIDFKKLPSTPGAAKIDGGFFEMTIAPGTVLKVPHKGGGFFMESGGSAYGPAEGNPVVELGLSELIRAKLAETPNTAGLEMLRHMIADGRGPVRDCAFRLLADLKSPQAPFDFDEVFHAMIHASIEEEHGSKDLSPEAQQGYTWFHRLFHSTRGEWERTRPLLAPGRYQPGGKPGAAPAIAWTPGSNGMSLGVSGLPAGTSLEIGKSVPVTVYLRNDTTAPVKLSVPAEHNPVIQVFLTDGTGKAHRAIYSFSGPLTGYSHHELAPGSSTKVAAFDLESYATPEEANRAEHKEGKAHNPRLAVPSGSYDLHLEYRNYQENPVPKGSASEWTGKLTAQPVPLKVAAVPEKQPAPEAPKQSSPQPAISATLNLATEAQLDWGEAVNGLRGAVVVRSPAAGEPQGIYLAVQNVSQAPLRFADSIKAERLRTMYVSASGRILFALSSDEPTKKDATLQPRQVAYLPMMPPAKTGEEKRPEAALIEGIRKDSLQTWKIVLDIQSAPEGAWKGKLTTGETRGAVGTEGPQPKNPQAQALFKIWQNNARLNGNIPGGLVRLLHEKVKEFIRNNEPDASGAPYAKEMAPIEPRFANAGDWKPVDVVVLLDDIAAAHTIPLETTMEHLARRTLQRGLPLPASLQNADWGEPLPGGLRMAYVLEPRAKEYHLGSELKARIVLHNSGKDPVAFVTTGFQQPRHSARLAGGGELKLDSTFWTTLGRMESYRLEPGDYCEIYTPGLGIGAQDKDRDDWSNVRAGSWIACAAGNEVVFAPGAAMLFYENNGGENKNWWLDFITERLSREAPVPVDTKEREYLLYRVVRELYGAAPSTTEGDAFAADKSPDALKNLAALLAKNPFGTRSHGLIRAGTTTFRVLPADPDAAKRPRAVNNPGWFTLGDDVKFSVTRRPSGERAVNEASIIYFQKGKDNLIHKVALPDGYNTWAAAWAKGSTALWVSEKGLLRKFDFTNPTKVEETRYEGDKTAAAPIPVDVREAMLAALDAPDAEKQIQEPRKPAAPGAAPAPATPAAEKPKGAAAKLEPAALLGFWRGKINGEDLMISFHRPPVETDVQVDLYFGRATIGTLASFTIAPDGGSVALMMHGANGRVPFGTMTPDDAGALKLELQNRQQGQTEVLLTRDLEEIATEPRQKEARELFAMWKVTANDDGTIPGTFIGMLAEEVRAYVKANPNLDSGMKLPKLLPRFVTSRNWTAEEAIKLLDDVAYYATAPIEARVAKAKLPSGALWRTMVPFEDIPVAIANWSEAKDGLRIGMRVVEGDWRIGGKVRVELWLHNAGEKDVSFKTTGPDRQDAGVAVSAAGADGREHWAENGNVSLIAIPLPCTLPAGHVALAKNLTLSFDAPDNKEQAWFAPKFRDLEPGKYKLRCQWSDPHPLVSIAGDWTGVLTAPELEFTLAAQAAPAKAGADAGAEKKLRPVDGPPVHPRLADDSYTKSGVPLAEQTWPMPPWGAEKEGLSAGLLVIGDARIGGEVKVELWVYNPGEKAVKFSQNPRVDVGLSVVAKDKDGKEHYADITQFDGYPVFNHLLLPPGHIVKVKEFTVHLDAPENKELRWMAAKFQLAPGDYKLRCKWSDAHAMIAAEGEWTGELTSGEVDVKLVAADAPATKTVQAKPAIEHATVDVAQDGAISFDREKVTLDELKARATKNAKKWITIRADKNVPYAKVIEVVEALKAAGVIEFSFSEARVGDGKYRVANRQDSYKFDDKHHFSICRPSDYPQFFTVSWPSEGDRPACWLRTYPNVSGQTQGKWAVVWEPGTNVLWWVDDSDVGKMTLTDPARVIVDREGRTNNFSRDFGLPDEVKTEFRRLGFVIGRDKTPGLETAIGGNTGGQSIVSAEFGAWSIVGTVTDADGKPLANVPVRVSTNQELKTEKTNAKGEYRAYFTLPLQLLAHWRSVTVEPVLDGFTERDMAKAGEFNVLLRAGEEPQRVRIAGDNDFQPGPIPRFAEKDLVPSQPGIVPSETGHADFVMLKAGEITGGIVTADGKPAPPHWVAAATPEQRPGRSSALQLSDAKGRFRLKGIPVNRPEIFTVNPDGKPGETSKSAEEKIESGGLHQIRITLPKGGSGHGALEVERVAAGAKANP